MVLVLMEWKRCRLPFLLDDIAFSPSFSSEKADLLRARFENNKHVEDPDTIDRMIADGEAQYNKWRHPDPYIVPWAPGGSKFTRNPTPPEGIEIVYNYGREDND
ncbi:NADH dehydrogenase [Populus alba x Populus x berolinensis]|nr:NADH dehydrogenase [Populus alba x Populus x berolinensis]